MRTLIERIHFRFGRASISISRNFNDSLRMRPGPPVSRLISLNWEAFILCTDS
jgi:hypothetical protein